MVYLCFLLFISWLVIHEINSNLYNGKPISNGCDYRNDKMDLQEDLIKKYYLQCHLLGQLDYNVFKKAIKGIDIFNAPKNLIAICDFTKPSNQERFFMIDLHSMKLIAKSLVAHGRNSGDVMATSFSNKMNSYQSSLGFYNIGQKIKSPKHGDALLLEGLEKGINDMARNREIIIHSADYVSYDFINKNGRLGRSHGCPVLPSSVLKNIIPLLQNGALLYIHGQNRLKSNS